MKKNLIIAVMMTIVTTILLGIVYPLVVTGIAQVICVALAVDDVRIHAVMRQIKDRLRITAGPQPIDVKRQHLADSFVIIASRIVPASAAPLGYRPQASRARPGRSRPAARRRNAISPSHARRKRHCSARAQEVAQRLSPLVFSEWTMTRPIRRMISAYFVQKH